MLLPSGSALVSCTLISQPFDLQYFLLFYMSYIFYELPDEITRICKIRRLKDGGENSQKQ